MRQRINALRERRGDAPGFRLVIGASNLLDPAEAAELGALVATERPVLIVIDTLAMAAPGIDENTSAAMSSVVKMARDLTRHGAAVLLVHHDTKAGTGTPRGHSLLNGALDMSLQLDPADQQGVVRGSLRKNRNGPCYGSIAFRIESVSLGLDADLESITAPIAAEVGAGEMAKLATEKVKGPDADLRPRARDAINTLRMLKERSPAVPRHTWFTEFADLPDMADVKPDSRRRMFRDALSELAERGLISEHEGHFWPGDLPPHAAGACLLAKMLALHKVAGVAGAERQNPATPATPGRQNGKFAGGPADRSGECP